MTQIPGTNTLFFTVDKQASFSVHSSLDLKGLANLVTQFLTKYLPTAAAVLSGAAREFL